MVAYQVTGEDNPVDLVHAVGSVSHLELFWDIPEAAWLIERLSSFARLIRFDKRGTGMSDSPSGPATLEERTDDIRAVMDAVGSERAFIFGTSEGGTMASVFAATYPERTSGLILWGTQATWIRDDDYPWGSTIEEGLAEIAVLAEQGLTDEYLFGLGAGVDSVMPEEEKAPLRRLFKSASSPGALAAMERMNLEIDIRDILPTIHVPTLVMNRSNEQIVAEIEEFVTGSRPILGIERSLATVMFTDIVDSTRRASELGDRAWRELVERHHRIIRGLLARSRGTEMDTAGDGFFATFDGPARAVRCALAAVDAVRPLGIQIRAGVHTGEVETIDGKAGGIAVVIGARIAGSAEASEVLASSTVKDLTAGSGLAFADVGERDLKGVPGRWRVYKATER